jgi:hypothetical protein
MPTPTYNDYNAYNDLQCLQCLQRPTESAMTYNAFTQCYPTMPAMITVAYNDKCKNVYNDLQCLQWLQ